MSTLPLTVMTQGTYPFDARGVAKRFRHAAIFGALQSCIAARPCASSTTTIRCRCSSSSRRVRRQPCIEYRQVRLPRAGAEIVIDFVRVLIHHAATRRGACRERVSSRGANSDRPTIRCLPPDSERARRVVQWPVALAAPAWLPAPPTAGTGLAAFDPRPGRRRARAVRGHAARGRAGGGHTGSLREVQDDDGAPSPDLHLANMAGFRYVRRQHGLLHRVPADCPSSAATRTLSCAHAADPSPRAVATWNASATPAAADVSGPRLPQPPSVVANARRPSNRSVPDMCRKLVPTPPTRMSGRSPPFARRRAGSGECRGRWAARLGR